MADRRRRRKRASQDSEEEDESLSGTESGGSGSAGGKARITVPEPVVLPTVHVRTKSEEESECESEDAIGEAVLSDYESADPEDNGSHSEGEEEEEVVVVVVEGKGFSDEEVSKQPEHESATDKLVGDLGEEEDNEEEGVGKEVKSDEKGNLEGERQSGDGQESTDEPENKCGSKAGKKLDDDEDRKNPAYIPRKGLFFEHDVRGQAHEEDIRPKGRHRKLWKDEGRWEHDKFREDEQAPKSREELVAMYGYDIRNANVPSDGRPFRSHKPRYSSSPGREKRWRDGEKPSRSSWVGSGNGGALPPVVPSSSSSSMAPPSGPAPPLPRVQGGGGRTSSSHPQARSFQSNRPPSTSYRYKPPEENNHQHHPLQHQGGTGRDGHKQHPEIEQGPVRRGRGRSEETEHSPVVVEEDPYEEEERPKPQQRQSTYYGGKPSERDPAVPALHRRREEIPSAPVPPRDASPAATTAPERTVERKSYSLARRTRAKPAELGRQVSLEDSVPPVPVTPQNAPPSAVKNEAWEASGEGSGSVQGGGLTGLDQDLARLSLGGQNWAQSPPSYLRAEMRGIHNPMHMAGGPPQYNRMEEMGVGGGRAKRYSSQRQRPVPEPAPMHISIMEGHYYDPMSFQGPIYAHSDSPTPLAPQGMLVQPEMHLTHPGHPGHPGLHPHQSGAPMPNPAMYAGPAVSMSPGQPPPPQLLPPPFYPPPGVMTFGNTNFPYAAGATLPPMYPNPQAQAQVYGGVTYYDTMQQHAQPKPSPPRRSSQPVTIKPPPPEVSYIVPE